MPPDPIARRDAAIMPNEADYDAFCATVMETARGRWFLAEYARRHRHAGTAAAIDALRRIEDSLRDASPARQIDGLREELQALAATIRGAKLDIGSTDGEFSKGAKVMALLDLLEQRIVAMFAGETAGTPLPVAAPARDERQEPPRTHLTVVSVTAAPEPIRARLEPPAVDLAPVAAAPAVVVAALEPAIEIHPDEMFVPFEFDVLERPLPDPRGEIASSHESHEPPPAAGEPAAPAAAAVNIPVHDPLTPVLALSIEERIALVS